MRINSGNIGMDSVRTYRENKFKSHSYQAEVMQEALANKINSLSTSSTIEDPREQIRKLKAQCVNMLIRLLFPDRKELFAEESQIDTYSRNSSSIYDRGSSEGMDTIHIMMHNEYYYEESESISFEAYGTVNCADGRSIDINLNLTMSRSFAEYYSEDIDFLETALTDPLVMNFDGDSSLVSDQTFYFDIDSDGIVDEISSLSQGSGFLALDNNGDGMINNGTELFGASSGNGFKELGAYDNDSNGWIDENDDIYDKLKIWCFDENGDSKLYSLKEKNVGAIYLGNAATAFSLNDLQTNATNAVIRSTGIYLTEDGNVNTINQVDFAKRAQQLSAYA